MTYYDVLNVPCDATEEEIKTAYRNMLKAFHPDYYTGDKAFAENMTQRIVEAYSVLKNPEQRRRYDDTISINKGSSKSGFESASDNTKVNDTESPENPPQPSERTRRIRPSVVLSLFVLAVSIYAALSLGGQFRPSSNETPTWDEIYSTVQSQEEDSQEEKQPRQIVYITENGTKYHREWCSTLARSKKYTVFLTPELIKDYGPCSVCDPPLLFLGD